MAQDKEHREPKLIKPKGRFFINVPLWIQKLALPKDDEIWMELIWRQLLRRNKRGQKLVIRLIDLIMIRFRDVARDHMEYCERKKKEPGYQERAEAIHEAMRRALDAQYAMREALELYYRNTPFGLDGDLREERRTKGS